MRCLVWFFIFALVPAVGRGQALAAAPLSLEQVLQLAEARSEAIGIARTAISRAEADAVRARSSLYPQLTGVASYERALASEFSGVFDNAGLGQGADAGSLDDLPFGRLNTWRLTVSLAQNLYSGGRVGAQQANAAVGRDTADLGVTTARAQLLFDVTQAYYDAALADRLVAIAEATVAQATATLAQVEAGFEAGAQPEFEVLRARVSRDTQNPAVIRAQVNRDLALLRLKQYLELPADQELRLSDSLADDVLVPAPMFAARLVGTEDAATPPTSRAAVQEVATAVRLSEAGLAAVKAERMPSAAVTSSYGRVAYPANLIPVFDRLNWAVGVNLQIPILTGGRQRADELSAVADVEQARLRLRQVEELAELDTRTALAQLLAARAAWEATAGTVQQATRAFQLAGIRYEAGVSTQLELSDARVLLQQADTNRAQAARDLQVARARVALLPELPLGNGGGAPAGTSAPSSSPPPTAPQPVAPQGGLRNAAVRTGTPGLGGQQ